MEICLTATKNNLGSKIDPRFGRCKYFIILDSEKNQIKAIKNDVSEVSEGVGVLAAQIIAKKQIKYVITGNVGSRAMQALKTAGIEVYIVRDISVNNAIEKFRKGELSKADSPTVCGFTITSKQGGGIMWRV